MAALQPPVSAFATAAAAMPAALRSILVDGVDPTAVDAAALRLALQQAQCYDAPAGHIVQLPAVLPAAACAALRAAVDAQHETASDSVDNEADHQLNLEVDELEALVGAAALQALVGAARELDARAGGELPIVEAFVRRYSPSERPWFPFHQDRSALTVNVALSADADGCGGQLVCVLDDGARVVGPRAEGDAAIHSSSLVHGVTRLTRGVRYSLIVFFGDEPAVKREIRDGEWVRTLVPR